MRTHNTGINTFRKIRKQYNHYRALAMGRVIYFLQKSPCQWATHNWGTSAPTWSRYPMGMDSASHTMRMHSIGRSPQKGLGESGRHCEENITPELLRKLEDRHEDFGKCGPCGEVTRLNGSQRKNQVLHNAIQIWRGITMATEPINWNNLKQTHLLSCTTGKKRGSQIKKALDYNFWLHNRTDARKT